MHSAAHRGRDDAQCVRRIGYTLAFMWSGLMVEAPVIICAPGARGQHWGERRHVSSDPASLK